MIAPRPGVCPCGSSPVGGIGTIGTFGSGGGSSAKDEGTVDSAGGCPTTAEAKGTLEFDGGSAGASLATVETGGISGSSGGSGGGSAGGSPLSFEEATEF